LSRTYDCADPDERATGIREAVYAVRRGDLIVLPTDTVYGIGADAFSPLAVGELLRAKRRGRDMPPPVLVGTPKAATALIEELGPDGQNLMDAFWPGALTIICRANRSLAWDLGDTKGTVAVRMPDHEMAIELLKQTGPLAVSSANLTGNDAAATAEEAELQLGDAVELYLDGGRVDEGVPSTIVDLTGSVPRILRTGGISEERIREVASTVLAD
jgi:tRNA threonylcarbamoyl adenosine modification protein (Sua5/YciO/YrdC/YwlC family)